MFQDGIRLIELIYAEIFLNTSRKKASGHQKGQGANKKGRALVGESRALHPPILYWGGTVLYT